MVTRVLLAIFIVLTLVCGGIAVYYNRVFEGLQVALAETKAELLAAQERLKEQRPGAAPAVGSQPEVKGPR